MSGVLIKTKVIKQLSSRSRDQSLKRKAFCFNYIDFLSEIFLGGDVNRIDCIIAIRASRDGGKLNKLN